MFSCTAGRNVCTSVGKAFVLGVDISKLLLLVLMVMIPLCITEGITHKSYLLFENAPLVLKNKGGVGWPK